MHSRHLLILAATLAVLILPPAPRPHLNGELSPRPAATICVPFALQPARGRWTTPTTCPPTFSPCPTRSAVHAFSFVPGTTPGAQRRTGHHLRRTRAATNCDATPA